MLKISRRKIQLVLGCLWLLDGLLQLQPKMFTSKFISGVVTPARLGQPFYINDPIHFASSVFLTHPAIFDGLIAATQIIIGLLIIYKPLAKIGLYSSVFWGAFVWIFGEALAGMLSGQSSLIVGLPGAALLYALIALAVIPNNKEDKRPADYWLVFVWAAIWVSGAIFELLPGQNSMTALKMAITMNIPGAPGWLARVDNNAANFLNHFGASAHMSSSMSMSMSMSMLGSNSGGYLYILLLALVFIAIGLGVLIKPTTRVIAVSLGVLLSLMFWLVGQNLGGYYTGLMTDVQTAPLLILLGLAIVGQPNISQQLKGFYLKVEKILL